jgi:uncharacterized protein YciI
VARPNFGFQKRQKEQAREAKRLEKLARKQERATAGPSLDGDGEATPDVVAESDGDLVHPPTDAHGA